MIQKTVVITGAGIGIGCATALASPAGVMEVVVTDILESEGRSGSEGKIEAEGGRGLLLQTRRHRLRRPLTASSGKSKALNNGIDVVVANSGIAHSGSARRNDGREMGLDHGR